MKVFEADVFTYRHGLLPGIFVKILPVNPSFGLTGLRRWRVATVCLSVDIKITSPKNEKSFIGSVNGH